VSETKGRKAFLFLFYMSRKIWKLLFPKATNFNRIRTRRSTLGTLRKQIREERKPIKNSNVYLMTNQEREERYKKEIKNITNRMSSIKPRTAKFKLDLKERKRLNKGRTTVKHVNTNVIEKENTLDEIDHKLGKLEQKIELFKKIEGRRERNVTSNLERLYVLQSEDTFRKLREEIDRLKQKRVHLSEYQENSGGTKEIEGEYDILRGIKF
jgi:chromosome segregation ATPase